MAQRFPTIPDRMRLPHEAAWWLREEARYFITLCAAQRGVNGLARDYVWKTLLTTDAIYRERRRWMPVILLAMPDHVHAIVAVPDHEALRTVVFDFKRAAARYAGVSWQRDFFDHRLRNDASAAEKFAYIENNPVRAGLVARPEDWPYRMIYARG